MNTLTNTLALLASSLTPTLSTKPANLANTFEFHKGSTFEKRKDESTRIRAKYADRIPVICEVAKQHAKQINLDRNKYLVPGDITVGQFLMILRKRVKLTPELGVYLFMENATLPPTSALLSSLYQNYKNEDGFLYITVTLENTFG